MKYIYAAIWIMCSVIIAFVALMPRIESFITQLGKCDCCKCGWMDCQECEAKISKCCDGYDYDRYTWASSQRS